jgi:hypothetical protein
VLEVSDLRSVSAWAWSCNTASMPKRSRKVQKDAERDENQAAFDTVQKLLALAERTEGKNPLAVALGRLGGLKGGKARAEKMTPAQRKKSAAHAASVRWHGKP